jgi:hypothetical protein
LKITGNAYQFFLRRDLFCDYYGVLSAFGGFASGYNPGNFLQTFAVTGKADPGHLLKALLY